MRKISFKRFPLRRISFKQLSMRQLTMRRSSVRRKIIAVYVFIVFVGMFYISHISPAAAEYPIADHYIKNAYLETGAENIVTSIYLNYRYYDTLFEAMMLLFSIIGVVYLSIHEGGQSDE